ncbi:MAG: HU family DNA-binding protein [Butyrivibrio sp.]|nr:HU family DNA-binding protein [Butyrivibrio sp.]
MGLFCEKSAKSLTFRGFSDIKANGIAAHAAATISRRFTMNKKELVAVVAQKAEVSKKDAEAVGNAFVEAVTDELKKGGKVQLVGFGTFEVTKRTARVGRNPRTSETIKIKASKAPKFKAGKALKDAVNKKK